jgi:hypothetical protein
MSGVTGNYVGEGWKRSGLINRRARRLSPSNSDKVFGRFCGRVHRIGARQTRFPLLPATRRRSGTWRSTGTGVVKPSLVNEALFGFNQIAVVNDTLTGRGRNANSTFGIAGASRIAG